MAARAHEPVTRKSLFYNACFHRGFAREISDQRPSRGIRPAKGMSSNLIEWDPATSDTIMPDLTPRHLDSIRNEFERGVFLSLYNSPQQRAHRVIARTLLGFKHGLRGVLFSWPLYLLPLAAWVLQARYLPLILLLLVPGLVLSGLILTRGVREDYARLVDGYIMPRGYPGRVLFPGNFQS